MPYSMHKQGGKWCVFNKDTGDNKGCSDTRAMAVKHMRALYAHAGDKSKAYHPDANYLNNYISYCNSLIENAQYSFMYESDAHDHEELISFSERLIDDLSGYLDQLITWRNEWYGQADDFKQAGSVASEVVQAVKEFLGLGLQSKTSSEVMTLTKQADGRLRVMLRVSNNFKDRHGEIITETAHKEYEAYVAETKDYPQFWLWHTPGTRWGQADLVSYDDGFLTMSGLVDQGKEYVAEGLAKLGDKIGVSHGFKYIKLGEETIDWYRSFEASPLPRDQAANVWTGYMLAKEWEMGLAEKHKKFFTSIGVPETVIQEWDSGNKDIAAALKEAGIEYKELADNAQVATKTETTETPVASPEQQAAAQATGTTDSAVLAELQKLNARFDAVEAKQKDLESKVKDSVASVMEAAIAPGATPGHVASKEGESPSGAETAANKQWEEELANFITGGAR